MELLLKDRTNRTIYSCVVKDTPIPRKGATVVISDNYYVVREVEHRIEYQAIIIYLN